MTIFSVYLLNSFFSKDSFLCDLKIFERFNPNFYKLFMHTILTQRGDVIWVASRSSMGLWKGVLNGRSGWFRPSFTEPCTPSNETSSIGQKAMTGKKKAAKKSRPKTVRELLLRIGLEVQSNIREITLIFSLHFHAIFKISLKIFSHFICSTLSISLLTGIGDIICSKWL